LAEPENKPNFWTTMPGLLTGVAAVLTAVTGMLVVMYPHGFSAAGGAAGAAGSSGAAASLASKQKQGAALGSAAGPGPEPGAAPSAAGAAGAPASLMPRQQKPTVLVLAKDGTETRLFLNGFKDGYSGETIQLKGGQAIPFEKIRSVDFLDEHDFDKNIKVTLTDGRAVEGAIMAGESMEGDSDIGPFSISVKSLKRILFER
jgi:hypothetical protein